MTVGFIRRDNVGVGREDKFEKAAHYTSESGHRLVYEVARRVEEPGRCIGRIEWGSLDGHMIWSPPTEFRFPGGEVPRFARIEEKPRTGSREPGAENRVFSESWLHDSRQSYSRRRTCAEAIGRIPYERFPQKPGFPEVLRARAAFLRCDRGDAAL